MSTQAEPTGPTITVRGEGEVEGPPELATVSVVLHTNGRTAADVTRSLASLSQQVDRAVPDLVFDSVRTDPLQVTPVFDRRSGVRITGYTGRYSASYTLADFTGLSDLVVALTSLPGAEVNGPSWSLRRGSALEQQARTDAVRTALARARDYATALGATLGDLLDLSDTDAGGGMARAFASSRSGEPDLDLQPQPQWARAHVTARFALTDVPASPDLPL